MLDSEIFRSLEEDFFYRLLDNRVLEKAFKRAFTDEIDTIITRIGRPEIATDPMLPSQADVFISLKPQAEWKQAHDQNELVDKMAEVLDELPGVGGSFGSAEVVDDG